MNKKAVGVLIGLGIAGGVLYALMRTGKLECSEQHIYSDGSTSWSFNRRMANTIGKLAEVMPDIDGYLADYR